MAITEIASLASVKQFLRIPNPDQANADDATIQMLMDAATAAIEREVGHVVRKNITAERHSGGTAEIFLREVPVLQVRNVEEGWGYYNWELDDQEVNSQVALSIWAYSLDDPVSGWLTRRAAGNVLTPFVRGRNNIRVDYVVGREVLPVNAELAFCTLVSMWYRNTQLRTNNGGSAVFNAVDQDFDRRDGTEGANYGVPTFIIEMLKNDRRDPIFA